MRELLVMGLLIAGAGSALAQSPAPAAGSGGGGPVGPSVTEPRTPTGATPPGTPSGQTIPERVSRDAVGSSVIGPTATPPSPVPGNTGGKEAAPRR